MFIAYIEERSNGDTGNSQENNRQKLLQPVLSFSLFSAMQTVHRISLRKISNDLQEGKSDIPGHVIYIFYVIYIVNKGDIRNNF